MGRAQRGQAWLFWGECLQLHLLYFFSCSLVFFGGRVFAGRECQIDECAVVVVGLLRVGRKEGVLMCFLLFSVNP